MSDKNHIGPLIRQIFASAAARVAAGFKQVPQGTEVDQADDGSLWKLGVAAGSSIENPTPEWKLIGSGSNISVLIVDDPGAGTLVETLPNVTTQQAGTLYTIKNNSASTGTVNVTAFGAQTLIGTRTQFLLFAQDVIMLRADPANARWILVAEVLNVAPSPTLFFDPVAGDDNHAGTAAAPLATLDAATKRFPAGWTGPATINMVAGTLALAAAPKIVFPQNSLGSGEPILLTSTAVASGLGARTATGASTQGSGATFGTTTDTAGGLVVNAWRGYVQRWTSGAMTGRTYYVASNTATVFTIAGTYSAVPGNGDGYVIEKAGGVISWTSGILGLRANGAIVGMQHIEFAGPGGASGIELYGIDVRTYDTRWTAFGTAGIKLNEGAAIGNIVANSPIFSTALPTTTILGGFFQGSAAGNSLFANAPGTHVNFQRSVFIDTPIDSSHGPCTIEVLSSQFAAKAYCRLSYAGYMTLSNCNFDTIVPASGGGFILGAAVIFGVSASGLVQQCIIANTTAATAPGDAITVQENASVEIMNTTGAGNAGVGVRMLTAGKVKNKLGNTVTGTNDLQVGATAGTTTWGAANAATVSDVPVGVTAQLCAISL